jgi:hypothetical protein
MAASIFVDKSTEPTSTQLDEALGDTAGWTLALAHRGRRVFHLTPHSGFFTVVFTLGDRAVTTAMRSNLPEEILSAIKSARKYAEGRSFPIDVTVADDVAVVLQLASIKMSS